MNYKKFLNFVLATIFVLPIIALFSACNSKTTINAPTLLSVEQNSMGTVYAKHGELYNEYTPQFSLDGENWNLATITEDGEIQLIQYLSDETFSYRDTNGNEHTIQAGATLEIGIREGETRTTKATVSSNIITITLKKPQPSFSITLETKKVGETETRYGTVENMANEQSNNQINDLIIFDEQKADKTIFVLGKKDYGNFTLEENPAPGTVEGFGCWQITYNKKTSNISNYEYCVVDKDEYQIFQSNNLLNNAIKNNLLFFKSAADGIEIENECFKTSTYNSSLNSAIVVIRKKGNDTLLASPYQIVEIYENSNIYSQTFNPLNTENYNVNLSMLIGSQQDFEAQLKNSTAEIDLTLILTNMAIKKSTVYDKSEENVNVNSCNISINKLADQVIRYSDIGSEFVYTITCDQKTLFVGKIKVVAFS